MLGLKLIHGSKRGYRSISADEVAMKDLDKTTCNLLQHNKTKPETCALFLGCTLYRDELEFYWFITIDDDMFF